MKLEKIRGRPANQKGDDACTPTDDPRAVEVPASRGYRRELADRAIRAGIEVRHERAADVAAIARLIEAAFRNEIHSSHTESCIVAALRRAGQLSVSLVAQDTGEVVGHIAMSPVTISSGATGWYGLGPIAVRPDRQRRGIGAALAHTALAELRGLGGAGCVVLGSPDYYRRFGFESYPGLALPGVPPEYFQALAFSGAPPTGVVTYHAGFDATE